MTTRTVIQEVALVVLAVAAVVAAIWFAANGFMAAAYLGTATMCMLVFTAAALNRRDPKRWGPRINSRTATVVINVLSIVVIALYVFGLFF
jgi:small-conductance mechanosensitive channel